MKKSHKDIIKEDPEDLGEEWSSLRSVVAAPSATMVLVDEVTDKNDTYTEIITPVTNNQDEEEEDCIGCCFRIQRNNRQTSQRSTSGHIRKLCSWRHQRVQPANGPGTEEIPDFHERLPSTTGGIEAPSGCTMLADDTTNNNGMALESSTPVTNNRGEEEKDCIGCCFRIQRNNRQTSQRSTSGHIRKLCSWRHQRVQPANGPGTEEIPDFHERLPSTTGGIEAPSGCTMLADDTTNNNGMALESSTPVTNNRGEEEKDCIGCCFRIQRNNRQTSQRSTSGHIRKLCSWRHQRVQPANGPGTEEIPDFHERLPSTTGGIEAPSGCTMLADDTTNNNGMALESSTPVTNNRGEEEKDCIGCCFRIQRNNRQTSQRSTSGHIRKLGSWRHQRVQPANGPGTEEIPDFHERLPSTTGGIEAPSGCTMLADDTTNNNGMALESSTPVTNNRGEEEKDCIGCCFRIQRNNRQTSQRSTSGHIRKLCSWRHQRVQPANGPGTEEIPDFHERLPSTTGGIEAPSGCTMLADDTTNNNGMALESSTPVTNNRGEEEKDCIGCCFRIQRNNRQTSQRSTSGHIRKLCSWRHQRVQPANGPGTGHPRHILVKEYSSTEETPSDCSILMNEWRYRSELIVESIGSITDEDTECYMAHNKNSDKDSRIKRIVGLTPVTAWMWTPPACLRTSIPSGPPHRQAQQKPHSMLTS
ncbi:uncharacterized protein LOC125127362 isoform X2 [Phacochoerus africanus]|uniref:uncharacterized protein LOC125127362 isoform X2 n=1 Tax=Phacochoerus africanus TaxID=41426 RepID=UPI001FD9D2E6|nr:uncharacterized protein LOC125127362 isoform X2 [Phacochoerus africanus]